LQFERETKAENINENKSERILFDRICEKQEIDSGIKYLPRLVFYFAIH